MNPEIKQRWIAALKSGEYVQGFNHLKNNDGSFCCLGVLCELARQDGVVAINESGDVPHYFDPENEQDNSTTALPGIVMKWADLARSIGDEIRVNVADYAYLTTMNDKGKTFEQIAEVIRGEL